MIMADSLINRLRIARERARWSQQQLADRAGLSRAEISAIETGRHVPSAAAALAVAGAFGCAVEELFSLGGDAFERSGEGGPSRFWLAALGGGIRRIAVEPTHVGVLPHDGTTGRLGPLQPAGGPAARRASGAHFVRGVGHGAAVAAPPDPLRTLVIAGCDPAIGLLCGLVARAADVRVIPLVRSSRGALELLARGGAHVAGVHLGDDAADNASVARAALGVGYRSVHVARWTEGLALAPGLGHGTVGAAVKAELRWVGREDGSGARRCLDMILEERTPRPDGWDRTATDHRGVVETIRTGWAQAGVCVEMTALEGGLDFLPVKQEDYDFFYPEALEDDARVRAVVDVLRSSGFRDALAALPGYETTRTGDRS